MNTLTTLSDDPRAVPIRRDGYMDWTVKSGMRRMVWRFFYADGSSNFTHDPRIGFRLTERMMKARVITGSWTQMLMAETVRAQVERIRRGDFD